VHESEKERLIPVEWQPTDSLYPVSIQVEAWDRVGLIRDITAIIAEEKVNITAVGSTHHDDYTVSEYFTLETTGLAQLSQLLVKVEGVRGVMSVARVGSEAIKAASATASQS
jgi:GTP pyrophosphokinase